MASILVTGANGFIGRHLCRHLRQAGHTVRGAVRTAGAGVPCQTVVVGDIAASPRWAVALRGIDSVIHLAARVHQPNTRPEDYQRINIHGTRQLAREAHAAGIKQFIFLSSIAVNGPKTSSRPFCEADPPRPSSYYGRSKLQAEEALWELTHSNALDVTVVRPPLVYGSDALGNFASLVKLVRSGLPLPFGAVRNKRSFIGVDNLCSILTGCVDNPAAEGKCFCVADGEDVSTPEFVQRIADALSQPVRLFHVPVPLLKAGACVLGQGARIGSLCDSLQIDDSLVRRTLDWSPASTLAEGLARALANTSDPTKLET